MKKPYKLGIIVGRFQAFHDGHKDMIDRAIELCGKVGVFIGSSQESGTNKNPFSYETRESILKKIYGNEIDVWPLPDIGVGNNCKWGDYVIENVLLRYGITPDLFVSGKEDRRIDWFYSENGMSVAELYIPKTVDISASRMRELLAQNDFGTWKKFCDERLWDSFAELRDMVAASLDNGKTSSI